LRNFPNELRLTAIMPGFDGATTSLEERFARLPRYDSVERLIEKADFDAAIVCLPNNESVSAATKLVAAGKHVLLEKPGAATSRDLLPLEEALQHHHVAFQTGYVFRFDEGVQRLREMVRDGRFGHLISVEMNFITSDVRRRDPQHYLFDRS